MQFPRPRPRVPGESALAMINVVFLLLAFFVLTARIAPPDPVPVTPPLAGSPPGAVDAERPLHLTAAGEVAYGALRGEAALAALALRPAGEPLALVADAQVPAATLAALLPRLATLGIPEVKLVTRGR